MFFKQTCMLFLASVIVTYTVAISNKDIADVKKTIRERIFEQDPMNIPRALRLSFHDCVGRNGCDGCLDFNNVLNKGLEGLFTDLVNLYNDILPNFKVPAPGGLTKADFIALAGLTAVQQGFVNAQRQPTFELFKVGRQTVDNCDGINAHPDSHFGTQRTMAFFRDEFGLNPNEAVILLGAHSLGGACAENSNHTGQWTREFLRLEGHEYYDQVRKRWNTVRNAQNVVDWREDRDDRNDELFMLNVDIAINRYVPEVSSPEQPVVPLNRGEDRDLPSALTQGLVRRLDDDNNENVFVREFPRVYTKMIEKSVRALQTVTPIPNFIEKEFDPLAANEIERQCPGQNQLGGNQNQGNDGNQNNNQGQDQSRSRERNSGGRRRQGGSRRRRRN